MKHTHKIALELLVCWLLNEIMSWRMKTLIQKSKHREYLLQLMRQRRLNSEMVKILWLKILYSTLESAAFNWRTIARIQDTSVEEVTIHSITLWNVQRLLGLAHSCSYVLCCCCRSIQCRFRAHESSDNAIGCYGGSLIYRR